MKSLKEICEANELFFWCNSMGEINMPGDGPGISFHAPEELPPAVRKIYEENWSTGVDSDHYVVSCKGQTGLLLAALYNEDYVMMTAGFDDDDDRDTPAFSELMRRLFCYLCGKAAVLETECNIAGACCFMGDYSDPDGHEISFFIPIDDESVDGDMVQTAVRFFENNLFTDADKEFLKSQMKV